MFPELETKLEHAAPAPHVGPDIDAIVAGGRRLRTWRRVRSSALVVATVAAFAVAVPALVDVFGSTPSRDDRTGPASPQERSEPFRDSTPYDGPVYVDRIRGEEKYLIGEKEIVASGVVLGEPWSMVEYVTTHNMPKEQTSLCVEFFLGRDGMLGGGGNCAGPQRDGSLVTLSTQYWGDAPDIVASIGSIMEPAVSARVELEDGRSRPLEIIRSTKDMSIGWYVFFPPPFEKGRVVAYDAQGNEVSARAICFPIEPGGEFSMKPPEKGSNTYCSK